MNIVDGHFISVVAFSALSDIDASITLKSSFIGHSGHREVASVARDAPEECHTVLYVVP